MSSHQDNNTLLFMQNKKGLREIKNMEPDSRRGY